MQTQQEKRGEVAQAQGMRSVREMYRRLLNIAARSGYPRSQCETPYEFSLRLAQYHPALDPELALITEAYASARYSGSAPANTEVVHILGRDRACPCPVPQHLEAAGTQMARGGHGITIKFWKILTKHDAVVD